MKKWISGIIITVAATLIIVGCEHRQQSNAHAESDIKELTQSYAEAFNKQDIEKLMSLWSQDAIYEDYSSQEYIEGKSNLTDYFHKQFDKDNATGLTFTVKEIHFDAPEKASEKGIIQFTRKDGTIEKSAFVSLLTLDHGAWLIQKFSIVDLASLTSHYEQLKELNWLVGDWIDNDEAVIFASHFEWDESKNFLIQEFSMTVLGQTTLKGKQIIGWDPGSQTIRSWIFDSNGGFGESVWSKQENQWYAKTSYTLPDGGRGSATHVYKEIDANTYSFSSEGRDIDGTVLPNIGPFNTVRINVNVKK